MTISSALKGLKLGLTKENDLNSYPVRLDRIIWLFASGGVSSVLPRVKIGSKFSPFRGSFCEVDWMNGNRHHHQFIIQKFIWKWKGSHRTSHFGFLFATIILDRKTSTAPEVGRKRKWVRRFSPELYVIFNFQQAGEGEEVNVGGSGGSRKTQKNQTTRSH